MGPCRRASAAASSFSAARLRTAMSRRLASVFAVDAERWPAIPESSSYPARPEPTARASEVAAASDRWVRNPSPASSGRVLIVEPLHDVAPALDIGPQARGLSRSGSALTRRCTSTLSRLRSWPRAATRTLDVSASLGSFPTTRERDPAASLGQA